MSHRRVAVECYAGYKADQEPRAFTEGAVRRVVVDVEDRWRTPEASFYRVRADDGRGYLLRHDQGSGAWTLLKELGKSSRSSG